MNEITESDSLAKRHYGYFIHSLISGQTLLKYPDLSSTYCFLTFSLTDAMSFFECFNLEPKSTNNTSR